jgi:hypothetical protein
MDLQNLAAIIMDNSWLLKELPCPSNCKESAISHKRMIFIDLPYKNRVIDQ